MTNQALKHRIKSIAKSKKLSFNYLWKQLIFERFLARLSRSPQANNFVLKGGVFLSYIMEIGRETIDLDFDIKSSKGKEHEMRHSIEEITSVQSEDGFAFSFQKIDVLRQPHNDLPGYRIDLEVTFLHQKDKLQIDIGIGGNIKSQNFSLDLTKYQDELIFPDENKITLLVCPLEVIFAEKLEIIISKGAGNSRMKDYHDLILLIRKKNSINPKVLIDSITNTFQNRGTNLVKQIQFSVKHIQYLEKLWKRHLNNLGDKAVELKIPKKLNDVIQEINAYLESINI